jgi:hypothetical protein
MRFEEGQVYEGDVSISGATGPRHRWLVVAPFGRVHFHSIDDPLDLHCLTLDAAAQGVAAGALQLVDSERDHPILLLQREKERRGIHDVHLGLSGENLDAMYALLQEAVSEGASFAAYAAGEIKALLKPELSDPHQVTTIRRWIARHFGDGS